MELLKKLYKVYSPSGKERTMIKFIWNYTKRITGTKVVWGIERSVFSMVGKNEQKVLKTKGFRHGRENGLNISKRFFSLHGLTSALRLRGFSSDIRGIALHRACRWG